MHSAGQKAAVSSTVSDFLQHILWWPRWAQYGAPVLLLGLTQEHSCLAHLLILFYLTEKCFCFCNQGFWGVWGTLGCPRQGGFSPPKQARQHPTRQSGYPRRRVDIYFAGPSRARLSRSLRQRPQGAAGLACHSSVFLPAAL